MPVQYGGGLRSLPAVREALRAGAERVIVGTAAFRDIDFLDAVIAAFGPRVLVSVDVRGGHISTAGWTQTTQMPAGDAIRRLGDRGVSSFVYTDVDRDGQASRAPTSTTSATSRSRSAGASSTRAGSAASTTCARSPACARSTSPA